MGFRARLHELEPQQHGTPFLWSYPKGTGANSSQVLSTVMGRVGALCMLIAVLFIIIRMENNIWDLGPDFDMGHSKGRRHSGYSEFSIFFWGSGNMSPLGSNELSHRS